MQLSYPAQIEPGYPGLVVASVRRRSGVYSGGRVAQVVRLTPNSGASSYAVTITYRGTSYTLSVPTSAPLTGLVAAINSSPVAVAISATVDGGAVVLRARHPGTYYAFTVTPTGYTQTVVAAASDGIPLPPGVVVSYDGDSQTFRLGGTSPAGIALRDHVYGNPVEAVPGVGRVGEPGIRPGRHVDVLQDGEVWARLADGTSPANGAAARYQTATGLLTTDTGTGTEALAGAVFRSGAVVLETGERIAKLSLSLP